MNPKNPALIIHLFQTGKPPLEYSETDEEYEDEDDTIDVDSNGSTHESRQPDHYKPGCCHGTAEGDDQNVQHGGSSITHDRRIPSSISRIISNPHLIIVTCLMILITDRYVIMGKV